MGCTVSINMIHTEGSSSDVVDETQSVSAKVDTSFDIPPLLIP